MLETYQRIQPERRLRHLTILAVVLLEVESEMLDVDAWALRILDVMRKGMDKEVELEQELHKGPILGYVGGGGLRWRPTTWGRKNRT